MPENRHTTNRPQHAIDNDDIDNVFDEDEWDDCDDIDLFELHDSYTIASALALEAAGFANRGEGYLMAKENEIGLDGRLPISTFGGLKARGNPLGATGVYQIVEVCRQLRGIAGDNQVPNAQIGMTQNLGGFGGTAVTHILKI